MPLQDLEERERIRAAAAKTPEWQTFIESSRPHAAKQTSKIMVEADSVYEALEISGAAGFKSPVQSLPNTPVSHLGQPRHARLPPSTHASVQLKILCLDHSFDHSLHGKCFISDMILQASGM